MEREILQLMDKIRHYEKEKEICDITDRDKGQMQTRKESWLDENAGKVKAIIKKKDSESMHKRINEMTSRKIKYNTGCL